ncbi:hypothetical protein SORBI_3005G112200 [Sorghum bicolor]|uniref:At2g35280-like TPR domain-containing protein n=1 Tax=Sorghum bicolor TaxID=4558 RepID=C5Y285_SORBI|nr:hypothetical protein SORBI_3005G112200 [Sorghum bicolor]
MVMTRSMAARRKAARQRALAVRTQSRAARKKALVVPPLMLPRHAQSVQGGRRRKTIGTGAGIRHEVVHNDRYLELVDNLAAVGNLEACFVRGLMLVFAKRCMHDGTQCLAPAAAADHKVAAYVLGVLHYCYGEKQEAKPYIRQVEGEDEGGVAMVPVPVTLVEDGHDCKGGACGVPEGWADGCAIFCSEACRIRHEYYKFISRVSFPST